MFPKDWKVDVSTWTSIFFEVNFFELRTRPTCAHSCFLNAFRRQLLLPQISKRGILRIFVVSGKYVLKFISELVPHGIDKWTCAHWFWNGPWSFLKLISHHPSDKNTEDSRRSASTALQAIGNPETKINASPIVSPLGKKFQEINFEMFSQRQSKKRSIHHLLIWKEKQLPSKWF